MTKYREILRLHSQGISQRSIAASCACSRNTVAKVLRRAEAIGILWLLEKNLSDGELRELFFPETIQSSRMRIPAYPDGISGSIRTPCTSDLIIR